MSLVNIINELVVSDVSKSVKFYEDNFGFNLEDSFGEPIVWAMVKKDNIVLMFEDYNEACNEMKNYPPKVNSSNLIMFEYSDQDSAKNLYELLKRNNVEFFKDYTETDYGKIEFGIYDLDKNMILVSALME